MRIFYIKETREKRTMTILKKEGVGACPKFEPQWHTVWSTFVLSFTCHISELVSLKEQLFLSPLYSLWCPPLFQRYKHIGSGISLGFWWKLQFFPDENTNIHIKKPTFIDNHRRVPDLCVDSRHVASHAKAQKLLHWHPAMRLELQKEELRTPTLDCFTISGKAFSFPTKACLVLTIQEPQNAYVSSASCWEWL